jgi:hypothetical protein
MWSTSADGTRASSSGAQGGLGGAATGGNVASGGGGPGGNGLSQGGAGGATAAGATGGAGGGANGYALVFAGGAEGLLGARYDGTSWSTQALPGTTDRAPGVAIVHQALGVAVFRAGGGALSYSLEGNGTFSMPAPIAAAVTTQSAPAIVRRGAAAEVVFHGDDFKHYYASYAGAWLPTAEPVKPANELQSFGPSAGAITAVGSELVLAFAGDNGGLFEQSRTLASWGTAAQHPNTALVVTPALVALVAGPELMVVYPRTSDKKLVFATRQLGVWTDPVVLEANSYSADPPSLAALSNGDAVLAFRGLDNKGYATRFDAKSAAFETPKPIAAVPLTSPPAVAPGVGTAAAEAVFVSGGAAYHARLSNNAWSTPVVIAPGALQYVGIASAP